MDNPAGIEVFQTPPRWCHRSDASTKECLSLLDSEPVVRLQRNAYTSKYKV